jgi:hypothetical protein
MLQRITWRVPVNKTAMEKRIRRSLPKEMRKAFDSAPAITDEEWQPLFSKYCWAMMEHCVATASKQNDPYDQQGIRKEALQWAAELRKLKYLELQKDAAKRPGSLVMTLAGFETQADGA